MQIYVPSVEFDEDGTIMYRSVVEYENAWLHLVYTPNKREMDLNAYPKLGMRDLVVYETKPIDEYHSYDDEENCTSWWRFKVGNGILKVELLEDEMIAFDGVSLRVDGYAFMVSLEPTGEGN